VNVETIGIIGLVALALGYAIGQFRMGRVRGAAEALHVANAELEVHRDRAMRLEQDLARYKTEVDQLRGVVEQLREENKELRGLLMGDKVQPAMLDAMQTVAAANREALQLVLDNKLRGIEQALLRLLTAKDEEKEGA